MLGVQIDGNGHHWVMFEDHPWLPQGSMIGPCIFLKVELDQEPRNVVFLCRGKDKVPVRVGERLKTANTTNQNPRKEVFDCFYHYAERTYLELARELLDENKGKNLI